MKKLILHIGHGKTGTSYIQSMLALNADRLSSIFDYPYHPSFVKAKEGKIQSGNGEVFLESITKNGTLTDRHKVFSGEFLFYDLIGEFKDDFQNLCKSQEVHILLYSRNVFEFYVSSWSQAIKRKKYHKNFPLFIDQSDSIYKKIEQWYYLSEKYGFKIHFRNYSLHKNNIKEIFWGDLFNILNCTAPKFNLESHISNIVNRSLTNLELQLLRSINFAKSDLGAFIADNLVNLLPSIPSEKTKITDEIYNKLSEKFSDSISHINSFVPASEALSLGFPEINNTHEELQQEFSDMQVEVIGNSLSSYLKPLIQLKNSTDELRNISLKIASNSPLGIADALLIMKLVQSIRPNGPVINKKISQWESLLNLSK